jgi:NodT family efflux transporter outer membrane factor (OMF) lipoprotein
MVIRSLTLALAAALLAACTVGPDYVRPDLPVPAQFARQQAGDSPAGAEQGGAVRVSADAEFWLGFDDPVLTALVDESLRANHDLRIALSRYDSANALLRGARLDRFPTVTAQASGVDGRSSADQAPGLARDDRKYERYEAGAALSWELDLFGRVRRGVEARRAEAWASASDLDAMQIAVVSEVVRTYADLRGQQERLRVARGNADNQRETLRLVQALFDAGRGTGFDTSRARAQLEATLARVPALESSVAVAMHRLAVLSGRPPAALIAELDAPRPLPTLPDRLDADAPGTVLRRRPDVAAAEHRLQAATARIGVATADLFPRFTLSGLIGSQAIDAGSLFERDSETGFVALGIDWSFLDAGRVRARIAAADADAEGELARYEQAVLVALEETENALVRYARARTEDGHLERAAVDSANAARLARLRFDAGAADLLEVLDAERTRLQAEDAFADARTRSVVAAVGVYRAMAGGWPDRTPNRVKVAGR